VSKTRKLHFELTPANNRRIEEYIERYNRDPGRVTPKIKTADVVNLALDRWLSARDPGTNPGGGSDDVPEA
jgi:hypothetical protein